MRKTVCCSTQKFVSEYIVGNPEPEIGLVANFRVAGYSAESATMSSPAEWPGFRTPSGLYLDSDTGQGAAALYDLIPAGIEHRARPLRRKRTTVGGEHWLEVYLLSTEERSVQCGVARCSLGQRETCCRNLVSVDPIPRPME